MRAGAESEKPQVWSESHWLPSCPEFNQLEIFFLKSYSIQSFEIKICLFMGNLRFTVKKEPGLPTVPLRPPGFGCKPGEARRWGCRGPRLRPVSLTVGTQAFSEESRKLQKQQQ